LAFVIGTILMKVQLIVVQGKPEGKTIPLLTPRFKIGRGETCHLRPNSEQVSREHAEFVVGPDGVSVTDLGSRNGTLVNGRALTAACALKNGDLVQVGPLTFAVSIEGAPQPKAAAPAAAGGPKAAGSLDDVSNDEIDSWLVADKERPAPETPSGVYAGDTITITAFKDAANPQAAPKPEAAEDSDEEYERLEDEGEGDEEEPMEDEADEEASDEMPEDFIDESNPFYVKKKKPEEAAGGPAKPSFKDTSDAASEILRKMMERRKQK
jgi:predicted component of type VI protein secretion system